MKDLKKVNGLNKIQIKAGRLGVMDFHFTFCRNCFSDPLWLIGFQTSRGNEHIPVPALLVSVLVMSWNMGEHIRNNFKFWNDFAFLLKFLVQKIYIGNQILDGKS